VVQLDRLVDELQEADPVSIVVKDAFLAVTPDRDVIDVARRFEP